MADITVNYSRRKRRRVNHPMFSPHSPQAMSTNQVVSPTGAAIAIRPPRTSLRRMDTRGSGIVSYF
jgi:hypothetical protein